MSDPTFSPSWYRVSGLRPKLRDHVLLHRHHYRGQRWFVLQDPGSGRCHRLSPTAHYLVALMDGARTTQQIWDAAMAEWGDEAPTQDETIRVLGLLHTADALLCDVTPDTDELLRRCARREESERWQRLSSPLSQRFRLFDPDAFLERWLWLARPFFTPAAGVAMAVLLLVALIQLVTHWSDVTQGRLAEMLDPRSLAVLLLAYPAVKLVHELAHAFASRVWGGAVHEIGVMLLVFMPVPYVDASASTAFPSKHRRMAVAAAGIIAELLLAALALFVWLAVEPGLVRTVAFSVMCIGGISTLLFNGNPLLRYDGYYVLADALEIPNLGARAKEYLGYLAKRHLFGMQQVVDPAKGPGEAPWLFVYGVASFFYRIGIALAIALFVAQQLFVLGVALALFSLGTQLLLPVLRTTASLLTGARFAQARLRAVSVSAALVGGFALLLFTLPFPLWTTAEGVVWLPDHAQVRAGHEGVVVELLAAPNSVVAIGDPLIRTRDPRALAEVAILEARVRELTARRHAEQQSSLVLSQITEDDLETVHASLAQARARVEKGVLRSRTDGVFLLREADDWVGRFVHEGELVAYVVTPAALTVRVVVPQSDIALVREETRSVSLRLRSRLDRVESATITRTTPAATERLPSHTLAVSGGGPWPVDPADPEGLATLTPVFELDLALTDGDVAGAIGERAYVRFEHDAEPLGLRGYRALRRLLLGSFRV